MSAYQDQVFQDDEDRRQWDEQHHADLAVLMRVSRGETNHLDFLYLAGRLNVNLTDGELKC